MELISVSEAARIIGYGRSSVYQLIHRDVLRAHRLGDRATLLEREQVERFRDTSRRPRGRPRKAPEGASDADTV
jgi:excisionase family DNA binding protein